MRLDVVLLPADLRPDRVTGRAVAVFDVLRATTTMTAALAAGVAEIRLFGDVTSAREAAAAYAGPGAPLLLGEARCLPPPGFDLGNSPGALARDRHAGRTAFMSTTNGTKAMLAARGAGVRFAAAVVNAAAVARALAAAGRDATLLCAGTGGQVAMEDLLGCGAVAEALIGSGTEVALAGDAARVARRLFADNRHRLAEVMADSEGGRNVAAAGLSEDLDFCARLDALDAVGVVAGDEPHVLPWRRA